MNQHRYTNSEITQQNSTTQCGPLAAAGQNLPHTVPQKIQNNKNKAFSTL